MKNQSIKIIKSCRPELLPNPDSTDFHLTKLKIGDILQDHEISGFMKEFLIKAKRAVLIED